MRASQCLFIFNTYPLLNLIHIAPTVQKFKILEHPFEFLSVAPIKYLSKLNRGCKQKNHPSKKIKNTKRVLQAQAQDVL